MKLWETKLGVVSVQLPGHNVSGTDGVFLVTMTALRYGNKKAQA